MSLGAPRQRAAPRFHVAAPLACGATIGLPAGAARHAQVLRLQPGDPLTLFNGDGGEYAASVVRMGRNDVEVCIDGFDPVDREPRTRVLLAFGMPANERMDWLVEKATELGAAALQPLVCERSVLRLDGERAEKKRRHWQAVATAASEQCGRTRVPEVAPVAALGDWLRQPAAMPAGMERRWLLSLQDGAPPCALSSAEGSCSVLSGPEGGLSPLEEAAARGAGFQPLSLGSRVLRADTAPLAALALLALGG